MGVDPRDPAGLRHGRHLHASWQKIFSTDPLVGYFQQYRNAKALLPTLTDPAKIEETRAIVRNTMIQGTLSIVFLVMVAFVMVCALIRIVQTIRNRDTTTSEDPYQESNFYAPETMIASSLMKKVSQEYEQVGDPALIPTRPTRRSHDADPFDSTGGRAGGHPPSGAPGPDPGSHPVAGHDWGVGRTTATWSATPASTPTARTAPAVPTGQGMGRRRSRGTAP